MIAPCYIQHLTGPTCHIGVAMLLARHSLYRPREGSVHLDVLGRYVSATTD